MEANAPPSDRYGPIPLIVGVTGHRDLPADAQPLERAVRKVLTELRQDHPSSKIVLLSSLAEGADRLVARVALDLEIPLVVPLPLEQTAYETDFQTEESLREFRALIERAEAVFVVPPVDGRHADFTIRDERSHAYANCGAYLVNKSIEIIALWDGVSEPARGTAEVVAFQLEGVPAPYVTRRKELDLTVVGPVKHVTTPRGADIGDAGPSEHESRTIYPRILGDAGAAFEKAKADVDRFNHDALISARAGRTRTVREDAGAVAGIYRARTTLALGIIFVAAFLSVAGFNIYSMLPSHPLWLLTAYMACIAVAVGVFALSKRGDWQNRHQDCRAFAEVLRVAHYWKIAGIDESAADVFAENHRAEIDWLPFAIRSVTEPHVVPAPDRSTESAAASLRRVREEWLAHEYHYFTAFAGRRERARTGVVTRLVSISLFVAIVITIAMRLLPGFGVSDALDQGVLFAATMLAIAAALLSNYAEKRGWAEHARRYEMMAVIFGRAHEQVSQLLGNGEPDAATIARVRDILRSLGEEAIRESSAWLSLHRSRPINLPHA